MGDQLDDFVNNLQEKIFAEAREAYGEIGYQRWRNPIYNGVIKDPDGFGKVTGTCGDTMQIFLKFENQKVKTAHFLTDGCGASTVCGSLAAELAHRKTPDELADISGEAILNILGVFPEEDRHCAFLAAQTLQEALADYMKKQVSGGGDRS